MKRYVRERIKVLTEEELRSKSSGFRVVDIKWDGPGWYFIYHYSQPCPRGCCYDKVFEALSANARACEIKENIRELAEELKKIKSL